MGGGGEIFHDKFYELGSSEDSEEKLADVCLKISFADFLFPAENLRGLTLSHLESYFQSKVSFIIFRFFQENCL